MPFFDNFFKLRPTAFGEWLQTEKARQMFERLRTHLDQPRRMLEIGPGRGEFADFCLRAGIEYYAMEANIDQAQNLHRRGAEVMVGFAPPLPLRNIDFDAVVAWSVLEHMPDFVAANRFLAEMVRLTRPGGLIGVNCPDLVASGSLFWDTDYTHSFPTSMRRLTQMFSDQGLKIVDTAFYSGIVSGPLAHSLSWSAAHFPEHLVSLVMEPLLPRERIYRARITFLRNVFMVGRKPL